jgi:hypothetical protein
MQSATFKTFIGIFYIYYAGVILLSIIMLSATMFLVSLS